MRQLARDVRPPRRARHVWPVVDVADEGTARLARDGISRLRFLVQIHVEVEAGILCGREDHPRACQVDVQRLVVRRVVVLLRQGRSVVGLHEILRGREVDVCIRDNASSEDAVEVPLDVLWLVGAHPDESVPAEGKRE
eukprot:9151490-Lingulodinium_polyedra.AAC.1